MKVLFECGSCHTPFEGDLKGSKLLEIISQLLERFIELADIQLYGFTIFFSIFTLYEVDVS